MQFFKHNSKKMGTVYVFLATGFEEIEALAPIDILRRANIEVKTVSVKDTRYVESAHGIVIKADIILREADIPNAEMLILPGGMPGAEELAACPKLSRVLLSHHGRNGLIAAICAAPMVLGKIGILQDHRATCYPGFEKYLEGAKYTGAEVEVDRNIITAYGPGAAIDFGFTLLSFFTDVNSVKRLKASMMVKE